MAIEVPERGNPDTTIIGFPKSSFLVNENGRVYSFVLFILFIFLLFPNVSFAYVGPGAGFALVSSLFAVVITLIVAILSLLIWPFKKLYRYFTLPKRKGKPLARRVIVLGFDGQDPELTRKFMDQGILPNFSKLAKEGCFVELGTTIPAISPVAWSSFSTGTNPGKHNIYDFLSRDPKSYLPVISSSKIGNISRFLRVGKYRIPLGKPELKLLRKSKPFWVTLGEYGVWSSILRVPITFPPDQFFGVELSAMSVPDILGTQGTFILFSSSEEDGKFEEGGIRKRLIKVKNGLYRGEFPGVPNIFKVSQEEVKLPFTLELYDEGCYIHFNRESLFLKEGKLSEWVDIRYRLLPGVKVSAITRLLFFREGDDIFLYSTPLNIDPERPAMPISHPNYFAPYLRYKLGKYATLGLAEDTWALNEKVIDDDTFLQMVFDIDKEREEQFFSLLDDLDQGVLVAVFDATDRIQHMFWRYIDYNHPANPKGKKSDAIERLYRNNDRILGKLLAKMKEGDFVFVISDHGFNSFRKGINLNAWLLQEGYLCVKEKYSGEREWLRDVDWSRTVAYSLGLAGIYLNIKGREAHGIVDPGDEAKKIKKEIIKKLENLEYEGEKVISKVYDTSECYWGGYVDNAPDLIVGYNKGYRVSWNGARGVVKGDIVEDNVKAWSGDHCIDPKLIPGIMLTNLKLQSKECNIIDLAPTILDMFAVPIPAFIDGKSLLKQ